MPKSNLNREPRRHRAAPGWAVLALLVAALSVALPSSAEKPRPIPETVLASGALSVSNSLEGQAILTAQNFAPGDVAEGTVVVGNAGDMVAPFYLSTSNLLDAPGTGGGLLSSALYVVVTDVSAGGAVVYDGPLTGLTVVPVATVAPGETRSYRFQVTFLEGQSPTADNAFASAATAVDFIWTAHIADVTPVPGHCESMLMGSLGDDSLTGTAGSERMHGLKGADVLSGRGGDDCLDGDSGADTLSGQGGNDQVHGATGTDHVRGHAGNDTLYGGRGADEVRGGPGADALVGGASADVLRGGKGRDRLKAADGRRDWVVCGGGRDTAVVDALDVTHRCEKTRVRR